MVSYPHTLKDANNPRHHVRLTEEGVEQMQTNQDMFTEEELIPGIDCG